MIFLTSGMLGTVLGIMWAATSILSTRFILKKSISFLLPLFLMARFGVLGLVFYGVLLYLGLNQLILVGLTAIISYRVFLYARA